jgi:two-component system CheB/CheR fusion protein
MPHPDHAAPAQPRAQAPKQTPVVGIGASAGGIDALIRFLGALPPRIGAAYVIVVHLDPTHESQLAHVLGAHAAIPVKDAEDGMAILPDYAYVIVPDRYLTVSGDLLRLIDPGAPRGPRHPVDALFESVAEDRADNAVGIVLSGTGTNGTYGLRALKEQGGLVLVQDPATALSEGMPASAIAAGIADHVLPPEAMPALIDRFLAFRPPVDPQGGESEAEVAGGLADLLTIVARQSGQNFQSYKTDTLLRRVRRRMGLAGLDKLAAYCALLRGSAEECRSLARDLMISVTRFFRDPEAWDSLDELVIAPLVANRPAGEPIRIWVPGCATGEEAYTVAMLVLERARAAGKQFDLKIFATDAQPENLRVAREGLYPEAAAGAIPSERLDRFFTRREGHYAVNWDLREPILFAPVDLLRDPPFSRLDIITCRNFLIYVKPEAQSRVLALFHFGLREHGHLMLGASEGLGRQTDLFEPVSKKWRIFQRIGALRDRTFDFPLRMAGERHPAASVRAPAESVRAPPFRPGDVTRRALLQRYAPPSVLIDHRARVLYFHGATETFLLPPAGEPTTDLLAMAREGLRAKLRTAVREAAARGGRIAFTAWVGTGRARLPVSVTVSPPDGSAQPDGLLLVTFETPDDTPPQTPQLDTEERAETPNERMLEDELRATRTELQSTVEQADIVTQELRASNEEITSINEELQSTNEELETSREELQSYNEELHTINNQLMHKIRELEVATNDLNNLLSGTEIATIFLDRHLHIKWFSKTCADLLDLLPTDIGRPIESFNLRVDDAALLRDARGVLETLGTRQAEVRSAAGRWYLRRMLPYRARDLGVDGVVLTFLDINELKLAAETIDAARRYAEAIVETLRQPLLVLDAGLSVHSANRAFYQTFRLTPAETERRRIYDLQGGQWDSPELRTLLEDLLPERDQLNDFAIEHSFGAAGRRILLFNARRLAPAEGGAPLLLLAIEDVTDRHDAQERQAVLISELNHRVKNMLATVLALAQQTLRRTDSLADFSDAFKGRITALSRAHDLLVEQDWTGAELGALLDRAVTPYAEQRADRIRAGGPRILLRAQQGLSIAMVLHELATNSAKYGSLSVAEGRVDVTWFLGEAEDGPRVHLRWAETGGPAVALPVRPGFGMRLIEQTLAHNLDGRATLDMTREGLRAELVFPWTRPG